MRVDGFFGAAGTGVTIATVARQRRILFCLLLASLLLMASLGHDTVLVLYKDEGGVLWVGTYGSLDGFDPATERFVHYREKDDLPNSTILGILEDDGGNLWLSTSRGLSRFDPQALTFRNYDVSDGLQSNEFNQGAYFESADGELFFGGVYGLNALYPDELRDISFVPPVAITNFQLYSEPVAVGGASPLQQSILDTHEIALTHRQNFLTFEYAALHFSSPEGDEYACMMEGMEREWNYVGNRRFATYTSVPPGTYTLVWSAWLTLSEDAGICRPQPFRQGLWKTSTVLPTGRLRRTISL